MSKNAKVEKGEGDNTQMEGVRHRRRSARLMKEDGPEPSAAASAPAVAPASVSPAGSSSPMSSKAEDSSEATAALLHMKNGAEFRDRKRRLSTEAAPISKKKKTDVAAGDIRPTACFGSYYGFMKNLEPRMRKWHWDAYKGSNFQHYVLFGPPARDRLVLEHVLRHYVAKKDEFSFPDSKTGTMLSVKFDEEWVENHTGFPIDGELIYGNRDPHNRLWREYFEDQKEMMKAKAVTKGMAKGKNKEEGSSMRRYVEELLETLVESTRKKDIEDFVLLQILYQCAMIWCPNSSQGIPRLLFQYVDSIERVNSIAWGKFIFTETKRGIQIAMEGMRKSGVTYIPGCMPLIPLWYYEMTGIKKPALNLRWKPPLTNWVMVGGRAGSLRKDTIESKAGKASIEIVDRPISPVRLPREKYPQRKPSLKNDDISRHGIKRTPLVSHRKKYVEQSLPKKDARMKKKEKPKNVQDRSKKSSIDYILSQHIIDALDREDEIEKLTADEQIHFWRNTAKLNWKILHAVKRSKRYQWDACANEIRRLNKKLEIIEGTGDLIDPEDLKKSAKNLMVENDRHSKAKATASEKKKKIVENVEEVNVEEVMDSFDRGHDIGSFDYGDVTNIGKEASYIAKEVMQTEKKVDKEVEENVEGKKEKEGKEEVAENVEKQEEKKEAEKEEEKKREEKKEEKKENVEDAPETKVYRKRTKKVAHRPGTRPPSARIRTKSQLIRTPFTEGKKKGVEEEIIVVSHQKTEEPKIIKYYCKPEECCWDLLQHRKIKKKEEALLKLLNEGIPDISDFSIRLVDSEGTFVHNFRISDHVASKLTPDENRRLINFYNQKCHQYVS